MTSHENIMHKKVHNQEGISFADSEKSLEHDLGFTCRLQKQRYIVCIIDYVTFTLKNDWQKTECL